MHMILKLLKKGQIIGCVLVLLPGLAYPVDSVNGEVAESHTDLWETTKSLAHEALDKTWGLFSTEETGQSFAEMWDQLIPRLETTLELEEVHETLPDSVWFGRDKATNQEAIDQLMDEAIAILGIADAERYRAQIRELEQTIQADHERIVEYQRKRVAAPSKALLSSTVEDYNHRIAALEERIASDAKEIETLKAEFAKQLRTLGLNISAEQLDFLLSTVVGDDLIQMSIAFDNVKQLTLQFERLIAASDEDLLTARRYYGMYTILLRILDRMYAQLIEKIDEEYLPQISAIVRKTQALMRETQALQKRTSTNQQILAANIQAQRLTLKAAETYQKYLLEQRADVISAKRRLATNVAVALNTYETVKVSGEMMSVMKASQDLLDTLLQLQVPALRTFENLAMKREFEKLTSRLKSGV
jgi:uncharacterized coiled-coil protein SlyX